mmetsp:Transcript_1328/g.4182  ORF Transcript_1328/g.4182 Transcript_1328/m.4182 type:complete len:787 (+) Transcript_1328:1-2361(+)
MTAGNRQLPFCGLGNCAAACPEPHSSIASVLCDEPLVIIVDGGARVCRELALPASPQVQAWSPDGRWLVVPCDDGRVHAFDSTRAFRPCAPARVQFTAMDVSVAHSPAAGALADVFVAGAAGLAVYTLTTPCVPQGDGVLLDGTSGAREGASDTPDLVPTATFCVSGGPACCVACDPSSTWLVCASMSGLVVVCNLGELPWRSGRSRDSGRDSCSGAQPHALNLGACVELDAPGQKAEEAAGAFCQRLPVTFGGMLQGSRPTTSRWAPRDSRALITCWDGSVYLLSLQHHTSSSSRGASLSARPQWYLDCLRESVTSPTMRQVPPSVAWSPNGEGAWVTLHCLPEVRADMRPGQMGTGKVSLVRLPPGRAALAPQGGAPSSLDATVDDDAHSMLINHEGAFIGLCVLPAEENLGARGDECLVRAHVVLTVAMAGEVACAAQCPMWATLSREAAPNMPVWCDGRVSYSLGQALGDPQGSVAEADSPCARWVLRAQACSKRTNGAIAESSLVDEHWEMRLDFLGLEWPDVAASIHLAHPHLLPGACVDGAGAVLVATHDLLVCIARENVLYWAWRTHTTAQHDSTELRENAELDSQSGAPHAWRAILLSQTLVSLSCDGTGLCATLDVEGHAALWCLIRGTCLVGGIELVENSPWGVRIICAPTDVRKQERDSALSTLREEGCMPADGLALWCMRRAPSGSTGVDILRVDIDSQGSAPVLHDTTWTRIPNLQCPPQSHPHSEASSLEGEVVKACRHCGACKAMSACAYVSDALVSAHVRSLDVTTAPP